LPGDINACPACGAEKLRPGEKLQRTWASMWLMSQEQGLWPVREAADDEGAEAPSDLHKRDAESAVTPAAPSFSKPRAVFPKRFPETPEASHPPLATRDGVNAESAPQNLADFQPGEIGGLDSIAAESETVDYKIQRAVGYEHEPEHPFQRTALLLNEPPESGQADTLDQEELAVPNPPSPSPRSLLEDLSGKLSFRRSDFYLGLSVLVAVVALLWPTGRPQQNSLSTWERTLITLGVADPPPTATAHYQGDPDIRVWVDTHAALYYCPGDEFYGKSPDGHYTTQREAQSERFEPAQRSACIQ
jgi:hypothetical protein